MYDWIIRVLITLCTAVFESSCVLFVVCGVMDSRREDCSIAYGVQSVKLVLGDHRKFAVIRKFDFEEFAESVEIRYNYSSMSEIPAKELATSHRAIFGSETFDTVRIV